LLYIVCLIIPAELIICAGNAKLKRCLAFTLKLLYLFSVTSLRYKIGVYYLIIVVIALITSAVAVYNFSRLSNTFGLVLRDNYESVFAAQNMFKALERQENAQLSMLLQDIDLAYIQFNFNRGNFLGWLEKARLAGGRSEQEKNVLAQITQDYHKYNQFSDSL
jgi:hypothetical protein